MPGGSHSLVGSGLLPPVAGFILEAWAKHLVWSLKDIMQGTGTGLAHEDEESWGSKT